MTAHSSQLIEIPVSVTVVVSKGWEATTVASQVERSVQSLALADRTPANVLAAIAGTPGVSYLRRMKSCP